MEEMDIKELFNYILSKIYIIFIVTIFVLIVGNIYTIFIRKPMYKSTTTLVLVSETSTEQSITQSDVTLNNNLVATYNQIATSRNVLSQVINNLGLTQTIDELSKEISVTSVSGTQIIKISVNNGSADNATSIANEVAKVFISEVNRIYKLDNVSIVDKAVKPTSAYNFNPVKDTLIFILAGLGIGLLIILIIYYFDTSIKDRKIIEDKLELIVLGVVPKVGDKNGKRR